VSSKLEVFPWHSRYTSTLVERCQFFFRYQSSKVKETTTDDVCAPFFVPLCNTVAEREVLKTPVLGLNPSFFVRDKERGIISTVSLWTGHKTGRSGLQWHRHVEDDTNCLLPRRTLQVQTMTTQICPTVFGGWHCIQ
jgi:hypothetical protein